MNTAIIVAAGSGTRFAGDKPKQFVEILGKPLIFHTLDRFQSCDEVDEIVLVLSAAAIDEFEGSQFRPSVSKLTKVVGGGSCRAESVENGLAVVGNNTDIVAVHDGARPLVAADEIAAILRKADETGAACLVGEVTDTIKSIRGGEISATLDRTKLRRALTPQAFRIDVLRRAFEIGEISAAVTDECYLVEKLGHPIFFVDGSSRNIKVTRREDILLAEMLLGEENIRP